VPEPTTLPRAPRTIKRQCIYSSTEDSEVVLVFERNNAGLKKLSILSEQTSDSSAFLNAMRLLNYVLNFKQHFSFFIFPSRLTVTGLARVYCIYFLELGSVKIRTEGLILGVTFICFLF
jgi:hypothetical protein